MNDPARRHTDKPDLDPTAVRALAPDHPAMVENRTLFPSTVVEVTKTEPDRILVSGANSRKLGDVITKGSFKGYALYGLTLEERATCPAECSVRDICYGNGTQMARRHRIGDADVFFDRVEAEIGEILSTRDGLMIRLHVLGDFPSVEYVAFWSDMLNQHEKLAVYGYTARKTKAWGGDEIGDAIESVKDAYPDRFRIRWSSEVARPDGAVVVNYVPKKPRIDEGLVCPAQTEATACCASCGLCWDKGAKHDTIVFIKHGPKSGEAAAEHERAKAERSSFERQVTAVMPKARIFALKLCRDPSLADDIVQESAAKALSKQEQFEPGTNFAAWFNTIVKNTFLSHARTAGREVGDDDDALTGGLVDNDDPERSLVARQGLAGVYDLPSDQKEAILAVATGESYDEAAERLGVPVGTIRSRVSRGRDALEDVEYRVVSNGDSRPIMAIELPKKLVPKPALAQPPEVRLVSPLDLRVEAKYQRDLSGKSIKLIRKIVAEFSWRRFKPPICAETPDGLFVIDGQHTAIAAASHPEVKTIPVLIVGADAIEERADAFVSHNRDRLAMSPFQVFHAEVAAGNSHAVAALRAIAEAGGSVPRSAATKGYAKPGQIVSVTEIRNILRSHGDATLQRLVRIAVMSGVAPIGVTITRALRMILTEDHFMAVAALPDTEIAAAIRSIKDIEATSVSYAAASGQGRHRACAVLISTAAGHTLGEAA